MGSAWKRWDTGCMAWKATSPCLGLQLSLLPGWNEVSGSPLPRSFYQAILPGDKPSMGWTFYKLWDKITLSFSTLWVSSTWSWWWVTKAVTGERSSRAKVHASCVPTCTCTPYHNLSESVKDIGVRAQSVRVSLLSSLVFSCNKILELEDTDED